jgi:hypothetical protein
MFEIPLDELHKLIDQTEEAIRDIDAMPGKKLPVNQLPVLSLVILELTGFSNTAYVENNLGINPSHLNKFVKMRGTINKHDALAIANRLRTYLKGEDQAFFEPERVQAHFKRRLPEGSEPQSEPSPEPAFTVVAEQWIAVRATSKTKVKINVISTLLENIILDRGRPSAFNPMAEAALQAVIDVVRPTE